MGEWQQLLQSILLGLIFSYLLAKLISIVVSFKDDNLSIARARTGSDQIRPKSESKDEPFVTGGDFSAAHEADSVIAEHGSVRNESVPGSDVDDDDWEGVESTELDEMFSAATAFVAAAAADRLSQKVSTDVQLQLYGLYKIATEGPCSTPQPSALKMTARAKWYCSIIFPYFFFIQLMLYFKLPLTVLCWEICVFLKLLDIPIFFFIFLVFGYDILSC